VPRPPAIAFATLGDQLDRIAALAATGAWASVQAELGDWRRRLAIDQQQVQEHRAALQDLLERRRRLRGRLDAYTAKAAAVGCVEDEHLERLRHDAESLLYAAPADLEQAEDGLRRYQQALDTLMSARSGRAR
jgi:chromosome segregation ATPase